MKAAEPLRKAGLSSHRVRTLLGEGRFSALYVAERNELEFGAHWWWGGTQTLYTSAGLRVLAKYFADHNDAEAADIIRKEAEQLGIIENRLAVGEPDLRQRRLPYKDDE